MLSPRLLSAALAILMLSVSIARAQFIQPSSVVTSSQFNGTTFGVNNTINGSGLSGGFDQTSAHAGYIVDNHWTTAAGNVSGVTATFTFTTGQTLDVFYLWNHRATVATGGASDNYAVANFNLQFYNSGNTLVGSLLNQSAIKSANAQTYSFSPLSDIKTVVFTINSNFGDSNYTGLAEVGFRASAIPEPATVALWSGLGVLGAAFCWRRRAQKNQQA